MSDAKFVAAAVEGFATRKVQALVLDITANLRQDTPRRTGWARANWSPSIGRPRALLNADVSNPTPADVARQTASGEAAIAVIATTYRLSLGAVYITNGVPYIGRLNEGSSQQAPAGFVQAAVRRAIRANQ